MKLPQPIFDAGSGLAPAIIQNAATGEVLMLGYINEESWGYTAETGLMHFYSRSRERLWKKGETSGNVFHVVEAFVDCDADAVLVRVDPAGPEPAGRLIHSAPACRRCRRRRAENRRGGD